MRDKLQRTVNKLSLGEKFVIVCRYGSAQPKRVLVQKKKKNTKRTVEELLANQYGMMFQFLNVPIRNSLL